MSTSAVRLMPTTAAVAGPRPASDPATTASTYPTAAAATSVRVIGGEPTGAAPPTMSGKAKKNGLATPPVKATSNVAPVSATDPSTTNLAGPSVSDGSRAWTTTTKSAANASRMRIAASVSGHSPVTPTMTVVARMKTHATIRTTRSYVWAGTPSSVAEVSTPPTTAASAARRASVGDGGISRASGLTRPTSGGSRIAAITRRFAVTATAIRIRTGSNGNASPPFRWGPSRMRTPLQPILSTDSSRSTRPVGDLRCAGTTAAQRVPYW